MPYVIIGLILSLVFAGKCNLLSLEDKTARSLGVNVNTMRNPDLSGGSASGQYFHCGSWSGKLSGTDRSPYRKDPGGQRSQGAPSFFYAFRGFYLPSGRYYRKNCSLSLRDFRFCHYERCRRSFLYHSVKEVKEICKLKKSPAKKNRPWR